MESITRNYLVTSCI